MRQNPPHNERRHVTSYQPAARVALEFQSPVSRALNKKMSSRRTWNCCLGGPGACSPENFFKSDTIMKHSEGLCYSYWSLSHAWNLPLFLHIHAEDFACLIIAASYENDKSMIISGTILTLIMIIVRSILKEEEGVGCRERSVGCRMRKDWGVERWRRETLRQGT